MEPECTICLEVAEISAGDAREVTYWRDAAQTHDAENHNGWMQLAGGNPDGN